MRLCTSLDWEKCGQDVNALCLVFRSDNAGVWVSLITCHGDWTVPLLGSWCNLRITSTGPWCLYEMGIIPNPLLRGVRIDAVPQSAEGG